MYIDIGEDSSNYAIFIMENVEPPGRERKANSLRRQAMISSATCHNRSENSLFPACIRKSAH
jgi:hypothetical protein